jgi:S-adenosylmethionine:tRNA ribosyltransferase-isomerase
MKDIDINEFDYDLPSDRIAQYPARERDKSQLLIYKQDRIIKDTFINIHDYLPTDSMLVFNNTRVIRARILFLKQTGAAIEILCLEPISPLDYTLSFSSRGPVDWKCIVGNLKKWKAGILMTPFIFKNIKYYLSAERLQAEGDAWIIKFSWNCGELSFGEVIEATGHIPLPPYIDRLDEIEDTERYQTIYSSIKGSVASPTAGLHFTDSVFRNIRDKGINTVELTLHVGAGTFQPVKKNNVLEHEMHSEHFIADIVTTKSGKNNTCRYHLSQDSGKYLLVGS